MVSVVHTDVGEISYKGGDRRGPMLGTFGVILIDPIVHLNDEVYTSVALPKLISLFQERSTTLSAPCL